MTNASYCIENKQYTKDEFLTKKAALLGQTTQIKETLFKHIYQEAMHKNLHITDSEHVLGDYISNSSDSSYIYDAHDVEGLKYGQFVQGVDYLYDSDYCCCTASLSYEISTGGVQMSQCLFCADVRPNTERLLYCDSCSDCKDCFGCIGLRNRQYCILNKQYTKDEYEPTVAKLIAHMQKTPI